MKNLIATLIVSFLFFSCFEKEKSDLVIDKSIGNQIAPTQAAVNDEIVFQPIIDNKTKSVFAMMPLPANWQINNVVGKSSAMIDGPDGIKIYSLPLHFYVFTDDQYTLQMYSQSGQPVRRPIEIQNIIEQDFLPIAQKEGSKFLRQYAAPEIAQSDKEYDAMLFKVFPAQQAFNVAVSEWEDAKGNPYLIVIHQSASFANNLLNWSYYCHAMQATPDAYENAKKNLLYALANTRYNPQNVAEYNQREAQKANVSMAAHNQRMQQKQQQFDVSQRNFESKRDVINASISANYNNANAASDRNQNRFLNYIKDENTVQANGSRYQVESGSNQYWLNRNGEYVGSNDPNYDPNRNQGTDGQTWTEGQIEN